MHGCVRTSFFVGCYINVVLSCWHNWLRFWKSLQRSLGTAVLISLACQLDSSASAVGNVSRHDPLLTTSTMAQENRPIGILQTHHTAWQHLPRSNVLEAASSQPTSGQPRPLCKRGRRETRKACAQAVKDQEYSTEVSWRQLETCTVPEVTASSRKKSRSEMAREAGSRNWP